MIFFNHWLFRNYLQVYYLLSSIYNIHKIFWAVISSILTWKIIINEMWKQVLKTDQADHLTQKVYIQFNLFIPLLQSGVRQLYKIKFKKNYRLRNPAYFDICREFGILNIYACKICTAFSVKLELNVVFFLTFFNKHGG